LKDKDNILTGISGSWI